MTEKEALELAAQAWCGEKTRGKVVDPELAAEFARILQMNSAKKPKPVQTKKPYWLSGE